MSNRKTICKATTARKRTIFTSAITAISMVGLLTGCGSSNKAHTANSVSGIPAGPITLGAIYTLNGPSAVVGQAELAGDQAAIQYVNAHGGIAGHQVQLKYVNDQGDTATAVSQAQALVSDHVAAVIQSGSSTTSVANTAVLNKAQIPVIAPAVVDALYNTATYPYNFETLPSTTANSKAYIPFLQKLGVHRLGILEDGTPTSDEAAAHLDSYAKQAGITVVGPIDYSPTSTDDTAPLSELKAANIGALSITGISGFTNLAAAFEELSWKPKILTTIAATAQAMGSLASDTYVQCYDFVEPNQSLPPVASAVLSSLQSSGASPLALSIGTLLTDSVLMVQYAITKANSVSGPAIKAALDTITNQSFSLPDVTYTYSAAADIGPSNIQFCSLGVKGPYGLLVAASPNG